MSTTTLTDSEKRERLKELVGDFDTAMLVTRTENGGLRARALSIYPQRGRPGGVVFFDGDRFAQGARDRGRPARQCLHARWFPEGKDDPSLRILIVEPSEAAYWDASGLEGVTYLFEMAKAYVTGTKPDSDQDERHVARVKL